MHSDKVVKQDQICQANVNELDQKIRKLFLGVGRLGNCKKKIQA